VPTLVLASASPARRRLLVDAGFDPVVVVSDVDEEAVVEPDAWRLVETLAVAKASIVAERCDIDDAVVVGCDSMLMFEGEVLGKPATADEAVSRWRQMRGKTGVLLTGHCVRYASRSATGVADTLVRFGEPTDKEIEAYVATGEPLRVAGGFTLDGRSAPFVEGVDGDPSNVIGLSLPLLRSLLHDVGVEVTSLWS
jgi:septum formation protein